MHSKLEKCKATRVILVRHGQSSYNALGLYQGCSDESVLTEVGYKDARKTGNYLKGLTFDAVYTSSLKRAQQTAREILQVVAPSLEPETIIVSELLRETDLPAWQGKAFQYVKKNFPQEYSNWKRHPDQFYMNSSPLLVGERFYPAIDLYDRINKFWQQVLPNNIGKTLLLVVHGGTNRALISTALGITPDRYHCIQQSNCGISILNFPDGTLESGCLEIMNLASHVGENLSTQEGGKGLRLLLIPTGASAEQINSLVKQLKEINILLCLSDSFDDSQTLAEEVIKYHPETADLKVVQDLSEWLRTIHNQTIDSNNLVTGLAVAKEETIQTLICQAIGLNLDGKNRLQIQQGTISSIQYPDEYHPPILQAMNVGWVNAVQPNIR
ncbi:putative phosphoglycerate mutase [Calothrix sp. NIES-4071]|nr:putative phosphoglycerate mutase [Calothrix sp. NIES-4071]BAZ56849.1 putative phosphoglycerate mutase [Calothrix sp. NIES-4105]